MSWSGFQFISHFGCVIERTDNISFLSNSCNNYRIYSLMPNDVLRTISTTSMDGLKPKPYILDNFLWLFTHLPQQ